MANIIPYAFRGELFTGTHNFASGGDDFKLALYTLQILTLQRALFILLQVK